MPKVTRDIVTRLVIEGEGAYQQAMRNIGRELRALEADLKLVEAEYKSNASSAEALQKKQEILTQILDKQQAKVREISGALQNTRTALEHHTALTEELAKAQKRANDELEAFDGDKSSKKYAELQTALDKATIAVVDNNKSIEKAKAKAASLETALTKAKIGVKNTENALRELGDTAKNKTAEGIDALSAALFAVGAGKSLAAVRDTLEACLSASIRFESSLAGVAKTTDLSGGALAEMGAGLVELSKRIPAAADELAGLAETAAQLGIAKKDLLSFTEVMAALGVSTNLNANEASESLAKFANVTKMAASDYDRLGSVIVALGNKSATTERDIVSMATRLASTGELVGLTEAEIMALATTMSSAGMEADAGGTAISKFLKKLELMVVSGGNNLTRFADIAGVSSQEFVDAWESRPTTALALFVDGLKKVHAQGGSVVEILDELGIKEANMSRAVTSMVTANTSLSVSLNAANSAWEENTALAKEAATRYATTESRAAILRNSIDGLAIAIGNQLSPALGLAIDAGTGLISWATEFINQNTWLVPLISGLTTALGMLTAGIAGFAILQKITPLVKAFNLALSENPAFLVATAIAAVTTAVVALGSALSKPSSETIVLANSVRALGEEAKTAANSQKTLISDINNQRTETIGLISSLERLASVTNRSAGENAVLEELIGRLNQAVPELNLSYDALTGTLNRTTDQILEMAVAQYKLAEAEAYSATYAEAYVRQEQLIKDQAKAQQEYNEAKAEYEALERAGYSLLYDNNNQLREAYVRYSEAGRAITAANNALDENNKVLTDAEDKINSVTEETKKYSSTTNTATQSTIDHGAVISEVTEKLDAHRTAVNALSGAADTLTAALEEQSGAGQLNINTINGLIDAGYSLALQIDEETGAVTVNRDAYNELTRAKIEETIAALKLDRSALTSALLNEAIAAGTAAASIHSLAAANMAQALSVIAVSDADKGTIKSLDAQIAALNNLMDSIGKTAAPVAKVSKAVVEVKDAYNEAAAAAEELKAAEEKAMQAAIKARESELAEIQWFRDNAVLSEDAFRAELVRMRDELLGDSLFQELAAQLDETLYRANLTALEADYSAYTERIKEAEALQKAAVEDAKSRLDAITKQQDALRDKLQDVQYMESGVKYDSKGNKVDTKSLTDLTAQIQKIERYGELMNNLKAAAIPPALYNEILGMGIDNALEYGASLFALGEQGLADYTAKYEELREKSAAIAENIYMSDIEAVQEQISNAAAGINDGLKTALEELDSIGAGAAELLGDSLLAGMQAQTDKLKEEARSLAASIADGLASELLTISPSLSMPTDFNELIQSARVNMQPPTLYSPQAAHTASTARTQTADIVNAIGTMISGISPQYSDTPVNITIELGDGTTLARALLPSIRAAARQSPEVKQDY